MTFAKFERGLGRQEAFQLLPVESNLHIMQTMKFNLIFDLIDLTVEAILLADKILNFLKEEINE